MFTLTDAKIGVVGLGYVGLPLACLFSKKYPVHGFDLNKNRIKDLENHTDKSEEVSPELLLDAFNNGLHVSDKISDIKDCNIYIIAVPTPVDEDNNPDLNPIIKVTKSIGEILKDGDTVIYESTVYPGLTEEVCVPILESQSSLEFNKEFYVGYSPERINPGDKEHPIEKIKKITSGSTPEVAKRIDDLYSSVLLNGTHLAPSIKVAEAAKIIENSQRDVNIAFVNEIAKLFGAMGIDTLSVLEAAGTKWNFQPFKPGLVGGHCISVDPYYLIQRGDDIGVDLRVMKAARSVNSSMGSYVANRVLSRLKEKKNKLTGSYNILLIGFTFKEDCKDLRNTQVYDIYRSLQSKGNNASIYDPVCDREKAKQEYGIDVLDSFKEIEKRKPWDAIIYCVNHSNFKTIDLKSLCDENTVVFDVKGGIEDRSLVTERL
ncbi:MAG: nucleotide sugar dehydrogenase [Muribaculaceae bacterium]|nr:nucleotide sugar dehydrogenase [Muribaculaceae bacterium]